MKFSSLRQTKKIGVKAAAGILAALMTVSAPLAVAADDQEQTVTVQEETGEQREQAKRTDGSDELVEISDVVKEMLDAGQIRLDTETQYLIDVQNGQKVDPITGERYIEPTPEPTQTPTPEPTQAPTPEPTQTPSPTAEPTPTSEPTQAPTPEPTQTPEEQSSLYGDSSQVVPVYDVKETAISAENMPNAYTLAGKLVSKGFTKEAASAIIGAMISTKDGQSIKDIDMTDVDALAEQIEKAWNNTDDKKESIANLKDNGYTDIYTKLDDFKSSSDVKKATASFLAIYCNNLTNADIVKKDFSSANELVSYVAANAVTTANACYSTFFGGQVFESATYSTDDVREDFAKIDKTYLLVKTDNTNIYEEMDDTSEKVGTANTDNILYVIKADDNWYYIESGDVRGFVKKRDARNTTVSKRSVERKKEESYTYAKALVKLEDNEAAAYEKSTVYNFKKPSDEEIKTYADSLLTENNKLSSEQWVVNTLSFYGILDENEDDLFEVLDGVGITSDLSNAKEGYIVSYNEKIDEDKVNNNKINEEKTNADKAAFANKKDEEKTEEEKKEEKKVTVYLYAVSNGDGTFTAISADGTVVKDKKINESDVNFVVDPVGKETINNVPYYCQGDFTDVAFNEGSVATDGCGITSFSMVASYLTDTTISPRDAAPYAMANGANTVTNWGAFAKLSSHYGIKLLGQYVGPLRGGDSSKIVEALQNGYIVIGSMTNGYFNPSGRGHYIVYTGITKDGKICINDPSSREKSFAGAYDQSDAFSNCKQFWVFTRND